MSSVENETGAKEKKLNTGVTKIIGDSARVFGETSQRTGVYDDARRICVSGPGAGWESFGG
ncbi:MAG: hypothetical protein ACLR7G_11175 [[Clostridium] symbiosum]